MVLKLHLAVGEHRRAVEAGLRGAVVSQEVLSCQFWWELGMWLGRLCGRLDILIEAWRHSCSLLC